MNEHHAIGIDIGGTKILAGIIASNGTIVHQKLLHTLLYRTSEPIVNELLDLIKELQKKSLHPIKSIGIGIAGWIDPFTGLILQAPNLGWKNLQIKEPLEHKLQMPVIIQNDVRAATWAEWKFGEGKGCKNLVCLFIGTGIGGGIISNGQLLTGSSNTAAELGHIPVELEGLECTCGGHGCLETLAGGWGIAMRAKKELRKNSPETRFLKKNFVGDPERITAKDVIQSFLKGDPFSKKIIDEAVLALIAGGTMIVNALNPETLILSGGIPDGFPSLISQIEHGIYKRAIKDAVKSLKVLPGYFKNNSGMIGAALYSLEFS